MLTVVMLLVGCAMLAWGWFLTLDAWTRKVRRRRQARLARQAVREYTDAMRAAEAAHFNTIRRLR